MKITEPSQSPGRSRDRIIVAMFWLMPLALVIVTVMYWVAVVNPQMRAEAYRNAEILAQSLERRLIYAMFAECSVQRREQLAQAMETILLLNDQRTGEPLIMGLRVELDTEAFITGSYPPVLSKGEIGVPGHFVVQVPLFSAVSLELYGIGIFYCNDIFFKRLQRTMMTRHAWVIIAVLGFWLITWIYLRNRMRTIRRSEERLQAHQAKLVHAGRLSALGEMATAIAHEINQPLTIIRLKSDGLKHALAQSNFRGPALRHPDVIIEQVQRAAHIIKSMRSFARQSGEKNPPVVDLAAAIKDALSFFQEQFRIHQIHLELHLEPALPEFAISQQKFEQVVVNLLSNARHAVEVRDRLEPGSYQKWISVQLFKEAAKHRLVLEIADNGIGMSREVRERCMEPFYTTKEVGQGTGLGLSITHGILQEYGLDMEVKSVVNQGSRFRVRLPIRDGRGRGEDAEEINP